MATRERRAANALFLVVFPLGAIASFAIMAATGETSPSFVFAAVGLTAITVWALVQRARGKWPT